MNWVAKLAATGAKYVWGKWLKAYRLRGSTIWTVAAKPSDSTWWRRFLAIRDEVRAKGSADLEGVLPSMTSGES